jgi:hypothetical protein
MRVQVHIIVVRDEDYQTAIRKLQDSGFVPADPNRQPPPEVMEHLPDPQSVLDEINAGYKRLDTSSATFSYPDGSSKREEQVVLVPNSFAHLPLSNISRPYSSPGQIVTSNNYDIYGNLFYPHEQTMVESLVSAAIDDEDAGISSWGELLRSWISLMVGYLDVNSGTLDSCPDSHVLEWYSTHFGTIHEANFGPFDRRITKRLGSKKEMPIDMRGHTILE